MDWSKRTVSDTLDVKGKEIGPVLRWYAAGEIWVNRRYQRKLVWSLKEKKDFIDSIINNFPTPSMILASYDNEETKEHRYEIIDGLQRINAIVSFALMEFPVKYEGKNHYFDMSESDPVARILREKGVQQKEPKLPRKVCESFLSYELPLVLTEQDADKIEQIFLRINSGGKKLTAHDLRQSGSCDEFANLVRRVSCKVRGEYSFEDLVSLGDMPKISIRKEGLDYSINPAETFWRRHDVVTLSNIRQSRDEELIAKIVAELFLPDVVNPSSEFLTKIYQSDNRYNTSLNSIIREKTMIYLEDTFQKVFDLIDNIFNSVDSDFSSWLFKDRNTSGKNDCFRIFYLTLYRITFEGYEIRDYKKFAEGIKYLADEVMQSIETNERIPDESWKIVISNTYDCIKSKFTKAEPHVVTKEEQQIERRLRRSSVESQMTEYKVGISNFNTGKGKPETFYRIACALSAMANTKSKEPGWVILGIADTVDAGNAWEEAYSAKAHITGSHYVTGIENEANKYFRGIDGYLRYIGEQFNKQPMDAELLKYTTSNYKVIDFYDKKLVILPSRRMKRDVLFDGNMYVRIGNESRKQFAK